MSELNRRFSALSGARLQRDDGETCHYRPFRYDNDPAFRPLFFVSVGELRSQLRHDEHGGERSIETRFISIDVNPRSSTYCGRGSLDAGATVLIMNEDGKTYSEYAVETQVGGGVGMVREYQLQLTAAISRSSPGFNADR